MESNHIRLLVSAVAALSFVACSSGEKKDEGEKTEQKSAGTPTQEAAATGDTIIVEAWTDGTGNYFKPNDIEAHQGDVLRFVLKAGVHNVHFLPDSNTIKTGLPPASDFLQIPEQTYDLVVNMQEGDYYFQCDPHAALGMKGKLEVEDKD
ncbi:MAG TPA: plastocyanin/azurin family copper-binding protein [Gemmatimonadaceae bacterium]|jgi:plastocyanin|nr:plastocyanin/azurin family copper-binding protein [Gemmatimonadaceae bacterium]